MNKFPKGGGASFSFKKYFENFIVDDPTLIKGQKIYTIISEIIYYDTF